MIPLNALSRAKATCPVLGGGFQKETLFFPFLCSQAENHPRHGAVAKRARAGVPRCFVGCGGAGCLSAARKGEGCLNWPGGKLRFGGFAVCLSSSGTLLPKQRK